jgi:hypothetical protein
MPRECLEGRCLSADPFARPTSIVLAYGKSRSGRSPSAPLGFDRNTPTFSPISPTSASGRSLSFGKPRVGLRNRQTLGASVRRTPRATVGCPYQNVQEPDDTNAHGEARKSRRPSSGSFDPRYSQSAAALGSRGATRHGGRGGCPRARHGGPGSPNRSPFDLRSWTWFDPIAVGPPRPTVRFSSSRPTLDLD